MTTRPPTQRIVPPKNRSGNSSDNNSVNRLRHVPNNMVDHTERTRSLLQTKIKTVDNKSTRNK
jgi:hypothetical protein